MGRGSTVTAIGPIVIGDGVAAGGMVRGFTATAIARIAIGDGAAVAGDGRTVVILRVPGEIPAPFFLGGNHRTWNRPRLVGVLDGSPLKSDLATTNLTQPSIAARPWAAVSIKIVISIQIDAIDL